MAHNVFDQHDGAFHDHAEIQSAQGQQVGGNVPEVQTNGGKQEGKRNGYGHDEGAANVPQKQKQNDQHQDHAFGEIVQDGVGRVVDQITAIKKRDDRDSRRQDMLVEFLHFLMDALDRGLGGRAFPQQHDAGDDIVVVDDLSILAVNGFGKLAEANFWAL